MDYYDDKRRSKFRSDRFETKNSSSNKASRHRNNDNDDDNDYDDYDNDDYYSSKKFKHSKQSSRSRSRSRSRNRSLYSSSSDNKQQKSNSSTNNKQQRQSIATTNPNNKYDDNYSNNNNLPTPMVMPTVEKRFNPGPPSRTIMLRQLPAQITDNEIRSEFNTLMVPYKDVRLVKNRDTGLSRGFAFIEFNTVEEAQRWMELTQGWLMFSNYDNKVQLFYSHSSGDDSFRSDRSGSAATEWDCAKCGIRNFKRRERCFKCSITREESDRRKGGDGYDYVGATPCNTLLLRGLDALTSKESITDALNKLSNYTLPIKNVHIARDTLTNVAMGFAFVEMSSIQDSGYLLQCYQSSFEIDGKQITINYSKNTFKTAIAQLETQNQMSYQQMANSDTSYNQPTITADAANSAAAVAQAAMLNMHKKQEILTHITSNLKQQNPPTVSSSSLLLQSKDIDSTIGANLKYIANQVDAITNKVYPTPDVTQYVYDESSGYYYDYSTGFYYDATSQYYFNSLTQQYLYWDQSLSTYVPVTSTASTAAASETSVGESSDAKKTEEKLSENDNKSVKPAKTTKTAAQIAKDMEKWAELMNKKKDTKKPATVTTSTTKSASATSTDTKPLVKPLEPVKEIISQAAISIALEKQPIPTDTETSENKKLIERTNEAKEEAQQEQKQKESEEQMNASLSMTLATKITMTMSKAPTPTVTSTAAAATDLDESSLIDTVKIACLLCKRKFDSIDILNKHVQKSDLHKTNLEKLKKEKKSEEPQHREEENSNDSNKKEETTDADSLTAALKYRDRAMERRKKYGTPERSEPPSPPYSSSSYSSSSKTKIFKDYDEDSSSSLSNSFTEKSSTTTSSSSVATKLMKKMGWSEGAGIGKNLQGISAPIEATVRQKGAGLGASAAEIDPNDSYQVAVKKSARARFERLS